MSEVVDEGGVVDVVGRLAAAVEDEGTQEALLAYVRMAFGARREVRSYVDFRCRECGVRQKQEARVVVPDLREQTAAMKMLLDRVKGRPRESVVVDQRVVVGCLEELEGLSLEELARVAAGG